MVIIGAKGFAKEVLEVIWQNSTDYNIAFFDDVSNHSKALLFGQFKILRSLNEVKNYFKELDDSSFTLGIGNPFLRYSLCKKCEEIEGVLVSTISPFARIGHFDNIIEDGCNIMTGVVITNSIKIGKGTLINLNCTIGHDTNIGEFVEMSPGTHISGNCKVGRFSIFGTNSTLLPKVTIGENVIIGAGAVVTKDVPDNSLVVGIPAKVIKELPKLDLK